MERYKISTRIKTFNFVLPISWPLRGGFILFWFETEIMKSMLLRKVTIRDSQGFHVHTRASVFVRGDLRLRPEYFYKHWFASFLFNEV